jgi:hypothetical protein
LLFDAGVNDNAVGEPERRLLEQVASLSRALREERERLARQLGELERELSVLASKLDGQPALIALGGPPQARRA